MLIRQDERVVFPSTTGHYDGRVHCGRIIRMTISKGAESNSRQQQGTDLEALLNEIRDAAEQSEKVSLKDILEAVGTRAYGPLLLVPGLLALAPTGAIPGMSIITGTIILVVATQLLIGRDKPWLPKRTLDFSFSKETLIDALDRGKPYAKRIDSVLKPSLLQFTRFPATRIIALAAMAIAATMYPLALVPFAVAIPSTAIVLFALGLTAHDGRLILAGFTIAGLSVLALFYVFM